MSGKKTIFVRGYESWTLQVDSITETSVKLFKGILRKKHGELVPDDIRMFFAGKEMREVSPDGKTMMLSDYNVQDKSTVQIAIRVPGGMDSDEKARDRNDFSLEFTEEPDAITGDNDPTTKRVKMSCGHAVDPNSLTLWCRSLLNQGLIAFHCPAILKADKPTANPPQCRKEWPYAEVRRLALLNDAEMEHFESKLSELAAKQAVDTKECPKCRSFIERRSSEYLRAVCPVCTSKLPSGQTYAFCWHCEKDWTGSMNAKNACDDPDCEHPDLPSVRDCDEFIQIANLTQHVPKRRACPTCGYVAEHKGQDAGCKFVICPRCKKEYCFACLLLKNDCLRSALFGWYKDCANGVAPKQTKIPVWVRSPSQSDNYAYCALL